MKMLKTQTVLSKPFFQRKRFYSLKTSTEKKKTFQHTVLLPKTSFPSYLKPNKVAERDESIQEEAKFMQFYRWQRENLTGEYVLHDGPPYANGKPHIGHAINKILKDIILRSQVIQGTRVHFIPGWDCHGLPIELTALKNVNENLTAKEIREKARKVATDMSGIQRKAFQQWGVMGDWDNQCYYTYDNKYIVNQLQIFWKLFEKGIIYHDLKPIYWSPSSRTALAEAELLYENHNSLSVIIRYEVVQNLHSEPLYLLIWTTTPWTVPLNKAVYCSPNFKYSIVKISSLPGLYVVASELIKEIQGKIKEEIVEQSVISSEELAKLKYRHPWYKDQTLDIFETDKLRLAGTGLLHSVPGHGHEDYILGLKNNLKVESFVDEEGRYSSNAGDDLAGLDVLDSGSNFVIQRLISDILVQEIYNHSYPYDWRTKQPVIIRASRQWFIDCDQLKNRAIDALKNIKAPMKSFESRLQSRPYWCLSRQRKWGVPIPTFFHKSTGRPLLNKNLLHHVCQLIESSGPDIWWTEDLETLFPRRFCNEFFVRMEDVVKGEDIMDIWFDSGTSWSYVLNGKKSELYLEGEDQYSGWFQSSLLTSVAVQDEAPFKKIMTHGFAVDEKGGKMSKSLGNVVDPEDVIRGEKAFGVDTLRWWVAHHSSKSLIPASNRILELDSGSVQKIRLSFRFLLGALNDISSESIENSGELTHLDRYLLNCCYKFYHSIISCYNSHNFYDACCKILYFVANEISARYVNVVKDRLYCDVADSPRRRACQYTINAILVTLCHTVAPILPHLVEEVYSYHPLYGGEKKFFYNKNTWTPPASWRDDSAETSMQLVDQIIAEGRKGTEVTNFTSNRCLIHVNETDFELLKKMQAGQEQSQDSELTELLQVAEVQLKIGEKSVTYSHVSSSQCIRCRRYTAPENEELCKRCLDVVS